MGIIILDLPGSLVTAPWTHQVSNSDTVGLLYTPYRTWGFCTTGPGSLRANKYSLSLSGSFMHKYMVSRLQVVKN